MSTAADDAHTGQPGTDVENESSPGHAGDEPQQDTERLHEEQHLDEQDERVAESFPASDPPAY